MASTADAGNDLSLTAPPLVPTIHKTSYPSLAPTRPELNQSGKTVLITGGSAGIGFAIARAYAAASASKIILTGRRSNVLQQATSKLTGEFPNSTVIPRLCDIADTEESVKLWSGLSDDGISVDVLVLNAAKFGQQQQPLLEADVDFAWSLYETNVKSLLNFCQQLHKQQKVDGERKVP
jgi:NADP-dependent 3-hydroxy acid dehydrogenase YdfG